MAFDATADFSSEIAMPLDSTAECAEARRGLKTVLKLCALSVLRGDRSLDFQTVSHLVMSQNKNSYGDWHDV